MKYQELPNEESRRYEEHVELNTHQQPNGIT